MRTLLAVTSVLALAAGVSSAQEATQLHIYGHPDFSATETGAGSTKTTQSDIVGRPEHGTTAAGSAGQRCQAKTNSWSLREYGASSTCN